MGKHWAIMKKNPNFLFFSESFPEAKGWRKPYLNDWKLEGLSDQEDASNKANVIFMQYEF